MQHELTMARMALNAQSARRNGDYRTAEYWEARVEQANLAEQRAKADAEWACLKGSPEHG